MIESIDRSRRVGLRRALIGLAIPMASEATAARLCRAGYRSLEEVADADEEALQQVEDIGPKVAASLRAHLNREATRAELARLRELGVDLDVREEDLPPQVAADAPLAGKTVVITGTIADPRSGEKVAAAGVPAPVRARRRDHRLVGVGQHRHADLRRERRREQDRQGREARRRGRRPGRDLAPAHRRRRRLSATTRRLPVRGAAGRPVRTRTRGVASPAIAMVTLLLGPFEVRDGSAPVRLGGRKPRALLARLALDANRTVPAERLIEDLWGEDVPGTAAKMVQIHVSQLRKVLPAGVLVTRPGGYALVAEPDAIDLVRFERLRDAGRAALAGGDPRAAARLLGEALALWRGEALAEFSEPFAALEAARLAQLRLDCIEDRIDAELALGHHAAVTAELEALVAREPLRERARAQLMLALYRGGRHADALATLQDLRRTLDEELGLVPSAALGELERRILQHDPSLLAPAADPGSAALGGRAPARSRPADEPPAAPPPRIATTPERRRVTAVALSFVEADALAAALDPEDLHELSTLARHRTAEIVERLGGCLAPAAGDQIIAGFGLTVAREDDVRRAVRAALELRDAIPGRHRRLGVRRGDRARRRRHRDGDRHRRGARRAAWAAAWRPPRRGCSRRRPPGAVVLGPAAARARPRHDGPAARPAAARWRSEAKRRPDAARRRARRSSAARRSSRSWPSAIAAPRRAADRSCSSSASPGIGKSRLVDELQAQVAGEDGRARHDVPLLAGPHPVAAVPRRGGAARGPRAVARGRARACGLPAGGGRAPRDAVRARRRRSRGAAGRGVARGAAPPPARRGHRRPARGRRRRARACSSSKTSTGPTRRRSSCSSASSGSWRRSRCSSS